MVQISTIIPTLNESAHIERLVRRLRDGANVASIQVIVADGGSEDDTVALAERSGATVVHCGVASRPAQLNAGARLATGTLLYFVHADTLPPQDWAAQIATAWEGGARMGCFRFRFDSGRAALRFNAWCTRIPVMMCRGGDQSLFVDAALFGRLGGFDESHVVMEDYDIIRRGRTLARFHILADEVEVSARKYRDNSYTRVNLANFTVFALYYFGVKPIKLRALYRKLINHPKFE